MSRTMTHDSAQETEEVTALIAGLRELADHLEQEPELALHLATYGPDRFLVYTDDADRFRTLASALGGDREKNATDSYMTVTRRFGPGIEVLVYTDRSTVCARRVVGTETVEVPDPDAPKVTIERPVYEWDCASVLAEAGAVDGEVDDIVDWPDR